MSELILLTVGSMTIRCSSMADAKARAAALRVDGDIVVEVTPVGGGLVTSLKYDAKTRDWASRE